MTSKQSNIVMIIGFLFMSVLIFGLIVFTVWQNISLSGQIKSLKNQIAQNENSGAEKTEGSDDQESKTSDDPKKSDDVATIPDPEKPRSKEFGYIKSFGKTNGYDNMVIDYAQFLAGAKADAAAVKDGVIAAGEHVDNDYYISNKNTRLRTHDIDPDAPVHMKTYSSSGDIKPTTITMKQFMKIWDSINPHDKVLANDIGYWVVLEDEVVKSVTEQYVP